MRQAVLLPVSSSSRAPHRRAVQDTMVCHSLRMEFWLSDTKNSPPGHLYGLQQRAGFCVDKRPACQRHRLWQSQQEIGDICLAPRPPKLGSFAVNQAFLPF